MTRILRERFSFCWIELEGQERRMGSKGLEAALIGTLARCQECQSSPNWLGRSSTKPKIANGHLWLEQHLQAPDIPEESLAEIEALFRRP